MKLEQQVVTVDQAKRLKELGVIQESLFCFDEYPFDPGNGFIRQRETEVYNFAGDLAMFTVAELGQMLPTGYDTMRITMAEGEGWICFDDNGKNVFEERYIPTEAECRGELIIHLLETKTITAEEVNKRLQQ